METQSPAWRVVLSIKARGEEIKEEGAKRREVEGCFFFLFDLIFFSAFLMAGTFPLFLLLHCPPLGISVL